ncbi:hypothetical protein ABW21_db0208641 [Orbilia brochopaga]|nr:hypothetical protein ABW21_db0208641 [Drechslerella brochopaga]
MFCNEGRGDTPTWVPDWQVEAKQNPILHGWASGYSSADFTIQDDSRARTSAIFCDTIKSRATVLPRRPSREQLISTIRTWVPENLTTSMYPTRTSCLDAFISTISRGSVKEHWPNIPFSPSLRQARLIIHQDILNQNPHAIDMHYGAPQWYSQYYTSLEESLPSYGFMQTDKGYYGLAPGDAVPGDQIYVIPGCHVPLLLRQQDDETFKVIGHCYLHGFMEAEALLGPLPDGWSVVYDGTVEAGMWFLQEGKNIPTRMDPRLGALPVIWEQREFSDGVPCWYNVVERGYATVDPRQTIEAIKARGIDVTNITLI